MAVRVYLYLQPISLARDGMPGDLLDAAVAEVADCD